MANIQYQLASGTRLDERYVIQRVIGEGGFGITYQAVNERVHTLVAIKELYCREFVARDCTVSNEVTVTYDDRDQTFARAKEHFLREARVIGTFAGAPGVVSVTDFFEENGTAYIVMNYLDGITLKKYLQENGMLTPQKTYEMLLPLMKTLENIHKAGIIHRDISVDNIMVLPDGQLVLLDFGSARGYLAEHDKTSMIVMKNGYTPCEQYDAGGAQGPWSDIYALTATMYECIVGRVPDNSLQRMMFDELRFPKELGIEISDKEEQILRTGLAVAPEQRYQSVQELIEAIDACYERHTSEIEPQQGKTQKKEKKKWHKWAGIAILTIVLLAGGATAYMINRDRIAFWFKDTETFYLQPSEDISLQTYENAVKTITHRIELLSGDEPYRIEDKGKYLRCVIVKDVCRNTNMLKVLRGYIARKTEMSIGGYKVERAQIASVTYNESSTIRIELKDTAPDAVKKSLKEQTVKYLVQDAKKQNSLTWTIRPVSELCFDIEAPADENLAQLQVDNYQSEEMETDFYFSYEIPSEWEKKNENNDDAGKNQTDILQLDPETVTLEYGPDSQNGNLDQSKILLSRMEFKQRLDALGLPYAIGSSPQDPEHIIVRMNQKDYNEELLLALPLSNFRITVQSPRVKFLIWSSQNGYQAALQKDESGSYRFVISAVDTEAAEKKRLEEQVKKAKKAGEKKAGLYVYGRKIASVDLDQLIVDGDMVLTDFAIDDGKITNDNLPFFKLLLAVMNDTSLPCDYEQKAVQYNGADGQLATGAVTAKETGKLSQAYVQWLRKKVAAIVPDCEVYEEYNGSFHVMNFVLGEKTLSYSGQKLEDLIRKLYRECRISEVECDAYYIKQRKDDQKLRFMIVFNKNPSEDDKNSVYIDGYAEDGEEFVKNFKKKWEEQHS